MFPSISRPKGFFTRLFHSLQASVAAVWGPVADSSGACRLQVIRDPAQHDAGALGRLPLNKLLLPAREPIWSWQAGLYQQPSPPASIAVRGLPLCELQGAWCLDWVFAEDPGYRQRRSRLFLVGSACQPDDRCRCRQSLSVAGDLFLGEDRLWLLSPRAEQYLPGPALEPGKRRMRTGPDPCMSIPALPKGASALRPWLGGTEPTRLVFSGCPAGKDP